MKTLRQSLVLGLLLTTPLFAQEECSDVETIHIINDTQKLNVINNSSCPNSEVFIALPKNAEPTNFNIVITQNATTFLMEIKDRKKIINGSVYSYNKVNFTGDFKIGERFRFNGGYGRDLTTRIWDVTHNHEYAIYKLDLHRYSIEPTIHQYARFSQMPQLGPSIMETNIQPASFGVFVRKVKDNGREIKMGVTAGPSMNFTSTVNGSDFKFQGQVNLRLTIPL